MRKKLFWWKRIVKILQTSKITPLKSSKCQFSWKLRLALRWPRITLQSLRNYALRVIFAIFWCPGRSRALRISLIIDFEIYQILSIFIIFVTFSCNRERCFRSPFRLDLELSFCMRSLKSINFAEKIVPAKTNCQNITNFENHTPRIT